MSTYKINVELEVEASDADDAEDIVRTLVEEEPAIIDYDISSALRLAVG